MKTSGIGGQAVMEGVMMRNGKDYAVAVRKPDNTIELKKDVYISAASKNVFFRLPLVRGVVAFVDSLILGMSTLTYSSEVIEGDDEDYEPGRFEKFLISVFKEKAADVVMSLVVIISILVAVGLFVLLPTFVAGLLGGVIKDELKQTAVEGGIRLLLFILYVWLISLMKDIKRTYMYHGAEHKCINCIEAGKDLTVENVRKSSRFHKRCGTSFLFIVMFISIIMFMFIRVDNFALKILFRLLLIPVISGISYEFIRLAGSKDNLLLNILSAPGMCLQRITTREPDDDMIEVGIASVEAVFDWKSFVETVRNADADEDVRFEVTSDDIDYTKEASTKYYENIQDADDENPEFEGSFEAGDLSLDFDEVSEEDASFEESVETEEEPASFEESVETEEIPLHYEESAQTIEEPVEFGEVLTAHDDAVATAVDDVQITPQELEQFDELILVNEEQPGEVISEEELESGFEQVLVEEPVSHVVEDETVDESFDSLLAMDGSIIDENKEAEEVKEIDESLLCAPLTSKGAKTKRKSKKESVLKRNKKKKKSLTQDLESGNVEVLKEETNDDEMFFDDEKITEKTVEKTEEKAEEKVAIKAEEKAEEKIVLKAEEKVEEKAIAKTEEKFEEKVTKKDEEITEEKTATKAREKSEEKPEVESEEKVKEKADEDSMPEGFRAYEYNPLDDDYEDVDDSDKEHVGGLFSKFKGKKKSKSLSYEERIARHKAISLYDEDYDESDELLRRLDEMIVSKEEHED